MEPETTKHRPLVEENVKLTMYQGMVSLRSSSFEDVIGNAYTFVNERHALPSASGTLIEDFHVADVKFLRKGKLGDVVLRWDPTVLPETLPLKDIRSDVGSIQFSCVTTPGDLKVSLLYFMKGSSLKISGGFPPFEIIKYLGVSSVNYDLPEDEDEGTQVRVIDDGIRVFFDDVISLSSSLCGSKVIERKQFILSGQHDTRRKIVYEGDQLYHFIKDTRLFDKIVPPMHELGGRRTAFKLYITDPERKRDYSCAFDHKGKVQMFSCANYAQVYRMKKMINETINMGMSCGVIQLVL